MAGFLKPMNEWTIRGVVLLSLGTHVTQAITAGIRRRESTGWRMLLLWLAYQVSNWAATYALSNLSLGGGTGNNTSREREQQQLVAFWVPFLLTHLGGPDNITAYSLEDNKLSLRQAVQTVLQVLGTSFVIYRQLYIGGNGTLLWVSVVMVIVGVAKYLERAWALREGDFGRIRSSSKKQKKRLRIKQICEGRRHSKLNDEQALVVAHDLLHITKGAFADYSIHEDPLKLDTNAKEVFSYGLENMCKVVEMELSLMYDILYTKAAVIHTWLGYSIRVTSLTATAVVTLLFWLYARRERNGSHKGEDVLVTFILLGATFILDVAWLTRAAVSTWTYAFLDARPRCWLHHSLLCTRRWHRFRRAAMSLHPRRLILIRRDWESDMCSYRLWSGTIGQYNLLHECTHDTACLFSMLVNKIASEEIWMEYQYSRGVELRVSDHVKKSLFEEIARALKLAYPADEEAEEEEVKKKKEAEEKKKKEESCHKPCVSITDEAQIKRHRRLHETLRFVPDFQELILIWHITTDVFLLCNDQQLIKQLQKEETVEAIKALSNYMVFLVTVRPDMIPGLKLRSLCDVTRVVLDKIWKDKGVTSCSTTSPISSSATRDQQLAGILRGMEKPPNGNRSHGYKSPLHRLSVILSDGTKFAEVLEARLNNADWDTVAKSFGIREKDSEKRILFLIPELERGTVLRMEGLLELIFQSWVRMLIFVSTRCGRDSHAKQLGHGCDLTTIVWILAEHAGIFRIR